MQRTSKAQIAGRIEALDYLRGFFILVIIVDHLWRWPSLFGLLSGEGQLWATAGEGFVIISGLLIGYIRGYKGNKLTMPAVSKKIWKRAALLYVWLVGLTILYTVATWYIHFKAPTTGISVPTGDWLQLIGRTVLTAYSHPWIYFLYFYVLLLAITPLFIYLLRKERPYTVATLTVIGYIIGRHYHIEWMQWMPMFFLPAIAGYYLPDIQRGWSRAQTNTRRIITGLLFGLFFLSLLFSIICTFIIQQTSFASMLNSLMSKEFYFPVMRIPVALLWFVGFAMLFNYAVGPMKRYFGWLLLPFGQRSLTAYILHGSILFLIAYFIPLSSNLWYNTALGFVAIFLTWTLVRNKNVQKIIPQ